MDRIFSKLFQVLIRIYAIAVSPLMGRNCRFYPTCSCYAHQALEKHGTLKGLTLAAIRILKCHPWCKTDWSDPVPERFTWGDLMRYNRSGSEKVTKNPNDHGSLTGVDCK